MHSTQHKGWGPDTSITVPIKVWAIQYPQNDPTTHSPLLKKWCPRHLLDYQKTKLSNQDLEVKDHKIKNHYVHTKLSKVRETNHFSKVRRAVFKLLTSEESFLFCLESLSAEYAL